MNGGIKMNTIDEKYGHALHIRQQEKYVELPTVNGKEYHDGWSKHKLNIFVNRINDDGTSTKEHRFSPLMQDSTESPLFVRIEDDIYNVDPIYDVMNFCQEQKRLHLWNDGGILDDLMGKNTAAKNDHVTVPKDDKKITLESGGFIKLTKNSSFGSAYLQDFTLLADVSFGVSEGKSRMSFALGNKGISLWIEEALDAVNFSVSGVQDRLKLKEPLSLGKEYRFLLQRKKGLCEFWLSGIHLESGFISLGSFQVPDSYYVGANAGATSEWMCGDIYNVVLWNKAIAGRGGKVARKNGQDIVERKVYPFRNMAGNEMMNADGMIRLS